jgi:membrane protease YdiL (CAAX protease family)
LILIATITVVAFYYLTRADTIGVMRGGIWHPMTLGPASSMAHFGWSAVLLGALPVLVARWGCRIRLPDLGLGLGNWKAGLALLLVASPVAILAGKIGAGSEAVRAVYPLDPGLASSGLIGHSLAQWGYFGSWEVLFRGVLLFGLAPRFGGGPANAIQTALSVFAHLGRPLEEIAAAIPAGLLFGAVDLRLGSLWWVAALHWIEGAALNYFILRSGG